MSLGVIRTAAFNAIFSLVLFDYVHDGFAHIDAPLRIHRHRRQRLDFGDKAGHFRALLLGCIYPRLSRGKCQAPEGIVASSHRHGGSVKFLSRDRRVPPPMTSRF